MKPSGEPMPMLMENGSACQGAASEGDNSGQQPSLEGGAQTNSDRGCPTGGQMAIQSTRTKGPGSQQDGTVPACRNLTRT
jgi:hypothetical protein